MEDEIRRLTRAVEVTCVVYTDLSKSEVSNYFRNKLEDKFPSYEYLSVREFS